MPVQPADTAPEATSGDGVPEPLRGSDPELLDEDGLLEEQPYVDLEPRPEGYGTPDTEEPAGGGSW